MTGLYRSCLWPLQWQGCIGRIFGLYNGRVVSVVSLAFIMMGLYRSCLWPLQWQGCIGRVFGLYNGRVVSVLSLAFVAIYVWHVHFFFFVKWCNGQMKYILC